MERWFVVVDGSRKGPFDLDQLVGQILTLPEPGNAPVWHQGMTGWTPAGQIPEIKEQLPPPVPAAPTQPPPIPAQGYPPPPDSVPARASAVMKLTDQTLLA